MHVTSREDHVLSAILARIPGLCVLSSPHFSEVQFPFSPEILIKNYWNMAQNMAQNMAGGFEVAEKSTTKTLLNLRSFNKKALSCALFRSKLHCSASFVVEETVKIYLPFFKEILFFQEPTTTYSTIYIFSKRRYSELKQVAFSSIFVVILPDPVSRV